MKTLLLAVVLMAVGGCKLELSEPGNRSPDPVAPDDPICPAVVTHGLIIDAGVPWEIEAGIRQDLKVTISDRYRTERLEGTSYMAPMLYKPAPGVVGLWVRYSGGQAGVYDIEVEHPDFRSAKLTGIRVEQARCFPVSRHFVIRFIAGELILIEKPVRID